MAPLRRTLNSELPQHKGERVRVEGWIHAIRKFGAVNFLILRDRSGMAQVILEPEELEKLDGLQVETVVSVTGDVEEEERAAGGVELRNAELTVITPVTEVLPFEINKRVLKPALDVFLNHAPVGLRYPRKQSIFRLLSDLVNGFRDYLVARDFVEIHTPKITEQATEGGANVFRVDYLGRDAFLAQSPQLYKQIMVGVFERVFEVGPAFRAEEHDTSRHLNEFTSLDAEMGFIKDHSEIHWVLLGVLEHMIQTAVERHPGEIESLGIVLPRFGNVPTLKFREAQRIIAERAGENPSEEDDFSPEDERRLGEWALAEHNTDFVVVTHFPTAKKPFYTHPDPDDPEYSLGFDLIFRGQELVSGGQRINQYDMLMESFRSRGMDPEPFAPFIEAFKYGMPPEGGFAIGSERLLGRLIEANNIRETTLFPRDRHRLAP